MKQGIGVLGIPVLMLFLALPIHARPPKNGLDARIKEIRAQYVSIENRLSSFKREPLEVNEGCSYTIELYRQGEAVVKISCKSDICDMADVREDYYFKDGRLFFAYLKDVTAIRPDMQTGKVDGWRVREDRVYVTDGEIIQHLIKEKEIEEDESQDLSSMPNAPTSNSEDATRVEGQINDHLRWFQELYRDRTKLHLMGIE